jgi:gliding motility associated protien GldN
MKRRLAAFGICLLFAASCFGQDGGYTVKSQGYPYTKTSLGERKVVPYPPLREADVIYAKRLERVIDTREKKNQVMNWPKSPLNKLIYNFVTTGEPGETGKLRAYRTDSLQNAMTIDDIKKIGSDKETVSVLDTSGGNTDLTLTIDKDIITPFDPTTIKKWEIVEEWIFDKQRGMFFPRIIALAPIYNPTLNGVALGEQPMFYVSYEDLRPLIVNTECFNRQNDVQLTYYDFFEQRMFSSYITKESNDKDFAIKDFDQFKNDPMGALYESERIKSDMFNWESDLWEY